MYIDRQHSSRIFRTQSVAITTAVVNTATSPTTTFGPQTYQVRVACNLACWIRIGDGAQTAVAGDTWLPASLPEYFTVNAGQTLSFISTSTSTGYFSLTEMA